jgi:hypothetical protein
MDKAFDEDEVLIYSLPFDEDIQALFPPAHQEENMMIYDPFKDLDDTLFHDFRSEVLEERGNHQEKGFELSFCG